MHLVALILISLNPVPTGPSGVTDVTRKSQCQLLECHVAVPASGFQSPFRSLYGRAHYGPALAPDVV